MEREVEKRKAGEQRQWGRAAETIGFPLIKVTAWASQTKADTHLEAHIIIRYS